MSYENSSLAFETPSSLSSFVGPSTTTSGHPVSQARQPGGYSQPDTFDWTSREINATAIIFGVDSLPFGPASTDVHFFDALAVLKGWYAYQQVAPRFLGFKYDSIQIRVTINNPKGIVGGIFVGWYPYTDYYDESTAETTNLWLDGQQNNLNFLNSTDCQMMSFGDAQDVVFTIPWTFKYPMFKNYWLDTYSAAGTQLQRPMPGFPVVFAQNYDSSFVSTITNPALLQFFVKFQGLEFYGPGVPDAPPTRPQGAPSNAHSVDMSALFPDGFDAHSGSEVLAAAAVGTLVEKAISTVSETMTSMIPSSDATFATSTADPGNYDNPSAVQMSYFGDITSQGKPQIRPVFFPGSPVPASRADLKFQTYMSRPALVANGNSSQSRLTITNDPCAYPTYMRYFAMCHRYWTGTINYHIVVTGHPMIQCRLTTTIRYNFGEFPTPATAFNSFDTHQETFYGSKTLTIPCPFLAATDWLPINDEGAEEQRNEACVQVLIKLDVISTMLTVQPSIPFFVFQSAGKDFTLAQPYSVGLNYTPVAEPPLNESVFDILGAPSQEVDFDAHIGIPVYDHSTMSTKTRETAPPLTLPHSTDMMELMQTWSRCVPFDDYNNVVGNEEPIPDAAIGFDGPCWWPPVDRARDYNTNNSWYFTLDYVHYFSILFLFFRGSIAAKLTYNKKVRTQHSLTADVLYVSIASDETIRIPSHCQFLHDASTLPPHSNFGNGTFATSTELQPVLEVNIPVRALTTFANTIPQMVTRGIARYEDRRQDGVKTNAILYDASNNILCDKMARKVDDDFVLAVESTLPPWNFWAYRGSIPI